MSLLTNTAPYWDDSQTAIDSNYMKILFKPGQAVQARELTQIQSILQNQITNLGQFVLADGSPVTGGHISFDGTVKAIRLQQTFANVDISLSDFFVNGENTLIINASGAVTVKAVVVAVDNSQTNPIIIVKYLTGNQFNDGDTIQVATGIQSQAQLVSSGSTTQASVASINYGVFYSGGYFVTVEPSTIVLSSSNSAPTCYVGLQIQESIIDSTADSTLLDPAQGSFNYQAPGADRYQYSLVLGSRNFDSTDTSAFYNLVTIENGLITSQVEYPLLGTLNNTLARRTFDTNGDFVVRPFTITTDINSANASQYTLVVSPGKAYVKGYEFETVGTTRLYSDKALSTNTITDYSISTEYGNILTVANVHSGSVSGMFDINNYQLVDCHLVQSGNINNANLASYNSTLIGSARVRNIEFLGLNNYYAYITQVNITSNSFIATGGGSQSIVFPAAYGAAQNNAYAGVLVTINTGGFIDNRTITNWNSANLTATLNYALTTPANSTSNVSMNFAIKDLESLVITPNTTGSNAFYTQGGSASALNACMDIAPAGKDITGNTVLADTQFNCLVFPLPQSPVAQGTITNASFYVRNEYLNQTFSNSALVISSGSGLGTNEIFPYGYNGYLSDVAANNNFLVVVRNSLSSNLSNGQVINFNRGTTVNGNGVNQISNTQVLITTTASSAFVADVYYTAQQLNASTTTRRVKTLVGNTSNVVLRSTDSYLNGNAVIGLTLSNTNNVRIDTTNGFVWFLNSSVQARVPGARQSLYVPDVFNIIKIYDSGNTSFAPNTLNAKDITSNYYLDSGQNDNFYDHSALILKSGVNPPSGQTVVMMQYFQHNGTTGFFDADSYSASVYAAGQIPYYASTAFGTFSLRDSIDFRPTRQLGNSADINFLTLYGSEIPQPDHTMVLSYQFYLPRIDKLLLTKSGQFQVVEGIPSQFPQAPADSTDAMTLYILSVPAYTANVKEIALQYVENKRYTMKDIGVLDTRISQLEYYSTLSQLEQQATAENILYQDNVTAKDQYGIIADDFGDFSIVNNQSIDLRVYLQENTLSPFKLQTPLGLNFVSNSAPYSENDKTYSLPFVEVPALVQNAATTSISVQPYLFAQFTGTMKLTPETDYWFSPVLTPEIIQPPAASPALPPLPAPIAAPALAPAANVAPPSPPVITSSQTDVASYWIQPPVYYYNAAPVYIPIGHDSYGIISPLNNWFGIPTSPVQYITGHAALDVKSTSIQLAGGTSLKYIGPTPTLLTRL